MSIIKHIAGIGGGVGSDTEVVMIQDWWV